MLRGTIVFRTDDGPKHHSWYIAPSVCTPYAVTIPMFLRERAVVSKSRFPSPVGFLFPILNIICPFGLWTTIQKGNMFGSGALSSTSRRRPFSRDARLFRRPPPTTLYLKLNALQDRTTNVPSTHATVQTVQFSWDPYETGLENSLLSSGVVSIRPLRGSLEAGQSMLLHVTLSAGCGPRFLGQQPMACAVRQAPPTTVRTSEEKRGGRVYPNDYIHFYQ